MNTFVRPTPGKRIIAVLTALILALTIYGGAGLSSNSSAYAETDPAIAEPTVTDPVIAEEPAAELPTAETPATEESATEEPATEESAADTPVAGESELTETAVEPETIEPEAAIQETPTVSDSEQVESVIPKAAKKASTRASADNELVIDSVEVLTHPEIQVLYRDSVYKGKNPGEDTDKYYTTYREFNLKDPRIFNLSFSVPESEVTSPDEYLESVSLTYGGVTLDKWGNGNELRGSTPIFSMSGKTIAQNADGSYTVRLKLTSTSPYTVASSGTNIPYTGYYSGTQNNFVPAGGRAQSGDNRKYWQAGPVNQGMGTYELAAVSDEQPVAAVDVHIGPYDEMNSWIEMNEWSQSLVKAITGEEIPIAELNKRPIGTLAKGYVAMDENGNFARGTRGENVWVEVSIIGYGLTDNYKTENAGFNNYSRFNPQWNVVVAQDEDKVDEYLNETVPTMNSDPQELIDEYKDADPEDIDMLNVYYQNNVHSDEVTGTDSSMKLIQDLIAGGKDGQILNYKTVDIEDVNLRYRVPTSGYDKNESSHTLKDGVFEDTDSRIAKTFDTEEALDKFIFVTTICSNPDAKAGMRRVNRYGLDLNRDVVFATQPETISLTKDIAKWDPLLMNEWHGYVQQMLIEPCTAPHDPAYEYDLLQNNMLQLAYQAGFAIQGSTGLKDFRIPWDQLAGGDWDDGGTIYAPMFAMLYGTYGYTVEFPWSNTDGFEAGNALNYAELNTLLTGETAFYPGNALNGQLPDTNGIMRDSHSVDNKYTSMRKSSVLNKLEVKLRGVENIDSMAADKYFIDRRNDQDVVVGRPRSVDAQGNTLPFFPDYLVVPTDSDNQYNVAEGIKGINHMIRMGAKVSVATADVEYDGKTIPKGAYVFDMRQGNRNVIFEVMSKGYDATGFPDMYADIYCNYPDVRGFDSIQVYEKNLYKGKLQELTGEITKEADISGAPADYVVFKSQSTDAVRFVNLLLSGHSSGPSTAQKGDVWMLRKKTEGVGNASDYIIKKADLGKIGNLVDNIDLGLVGCHIEGKYISKLPEEAVKLVDPVIQFNTTRTAQTGGVLWWALDDYLGFNSMQEPYNGGAGLRTGANVVVSNNNEPDATILSAVKANKLGMVLIQNASVLTDANFGTGNAAPTTGSLSDVALNGQYNISDSLFTQNYGNTTTMYARGTYYTGNIPTGAKTLFRSATEGTDAFIGGWQNTSGAKTAFGNRTMIFSTILKGGGISGKPVQALVIGQQMNNRSHYQKLLPMLATGIYAGAAGILDDFNEPDDVDMKKTGIKCEVTAEEPESGVVESGVKTLTLYRWDGKKYVQISKQDEANDDAKLTFNASPSDQKYKVSATDYAGNRADKYMLYTASNGQFYDLGEESTLHNHGQYKVTLEATKGGTVSGGGTYKDGDQVRIFAKANSGYGFLRWYDKASGETIFEGNDYHFTVHADRSLVAEFVSVSPASAGGAIQTRQASVVSSRTWSGKAQKPTVNVPGLTAGTDYTVAYKNNVNVGTASAVISGKGKFTGTKTLTFRILPKKSAVSKLTVGKKKLTVKWTAAIDKAGKYQIRYRVKGTKTWKTKTVSAKNTSLVLKSLKNGKVYQIQVRALKSVSGKNWYGTWSKAKASKKIR